MAESESITQILFDKLVAKEDFEGLRLLLGEPLWKKTIEKHIVAEFSRLHCDRPCKKYDDNSMKFYQNGLVNLSAIKKISNSLFYKWTDRKLMGEMLDTGLNPNLLVHHYISNSYVTFHGKMAHCPPDVPLLYCALFNLDYGLAEMLLSYGADINIARKKYCWYTCDCPVVDAGWGYILICGLIGGCMYKPEHKKLLRFLLDNGVDLSDPVSVEYFQFSSEIVNFIRDHGNHKRKRCKPAS